MFYARVFVGKSIELEYDVNTTRKLKLPPLLPNSTVDRYDSVKGNTNNTDVYMIYYN